MIHISMRCRHAKDMRRQPDGMTKCSVLCKLAQRLLLPASCSKSAALCRIMYLM